MASAMPQSAVWVAPAVLPPVPFTSLAKILFPYLLQ